MKKLALSLATAALFATGCASHDQHPITAEQVQQMQADIAAAKAAAQAAQSAAQAANMTAKDAKAIAEQTEEKLNRVFKKYQMK